MSNLQMPINADSAERFAYFYLTDGSNVPVTDAAGEQPQMAINSGVFANRGIGVLQHQGNGGYVAPLSDFVGLGLQVGDILTTRFDNGSTIEIRGSQIQLVGPYWSSHQDAETTAISRPVIASGTINRRGIIGYYREVT